MSLEEYAKKRRIGGMIDKSNATLERDNKIKPFPEGSALFKQVYCRNYNCDKLSREACRRCEHLPEHYK